MTLMRFLRYWLPGLVCLAGVVVASVRGFDDTGLDAASALFGAGGSIYLMNLLLRVGIQGDKERDREDEARAFFDEHGLWPDEVPPGWTPPVRAADDEQAPRAQVHKQPAPGGAAERHRPGRRAGRRPGGRRPT